MMILFERLRNLFLKPGPGDPARQYVLLVNKVRQEWQWAEKTYHEVTETDLVDQVIYWQSAAERKYIHLLKKARQEGITADFETIAYLALIARNKSY